MDSSNPNLYIQLLPSKNKTDIKKTKDIQENISEVTLQLKRSQNFGRRCFIYSVFILWIILQLSYRDEIKQWEMPILIRIYNSDFKDIFRDYFNLIGIFMDFDLSNIMFIVLSYVFLNFNHITGYIFTMRVMLINNCQSILQLIFQQNRPYWDINTHLVRPKNCLRTFSLPDHKVFNLITFCYISLYLVNQKSVGLQIFLIKSQSYGFLGNYGLLYLSKKIEN